MKQPTLKELTEWMSIKVEYLRYGAKESIHVRRGTVFALQHWTDKEIIDFYHWDTDE